MPNWYFRAREPGNLGAIDSLEPRNIEWSVFRLGNARLAIGFAQALVKEHFAPAPVQWKALLEKLDLVVIRPESSGKRPEGW